MRSLRELDRYRVTGNEVRRIWGWDGDEHGGFFKVPSPVDGAVMAIVASDGSDGAGWNHVSVSRRNRCPNWPEMDHVKRLFFYDDEVAVQYHVPASEHVNNAPYCLHLWQPIGFALPRPPSHLVGIGQDPLTPETARAAAHKWSEMG